MKLIIKTLLFGLALSSLASCKRESGCDRIRRDLDALTAKEAELRSPITEFNDGKDMALARIALQKAVLQRKLKTCEF